MDINFASTGQMCVFIALLTYAIMAVFKKCITSRLKCNSIIPPICMLVGCVISFVIMKIEPSYLGTSSMFEGLTIGLISGGFATSLNQVGKKLGVCINLSALIDNNPEPITDAKSEGITLTREQYEELVNRANSASKSNIIADSDKVTSADNSNTDHNVTTTLS